MYCEGNGKDEEQAGREEGPELGNKNKASPGDFLGDVGKSFRTGTLTDKQPTRSWP